MNRISLSDRDRFVPKEGEVFFAEVPGKGIDRKVKAVLLKDNSGCKNCAFFKGELKDLEPGKFILAKVEDEGYTKEICYDCAFKQNHFERMECCVANKCVAYFRDTNKDDIYYKPLAEVSE